MIFMGIDPGLKGGVAWVGDKVGAIPMPVKDKRVDGEALAEVIRAVAPASVTVEKVGAMPGQGVVSMFNFGHGAGTIAGVLSALGAPFSLATPQAWKKAVLPAGDHGKDAAIALCAKHFPGVRLVLPRCRKPHDGMADALCLALFCKNTLTAGK